MNVIPLGPVELGIAALLLIILAVVATVQKLALGQKILISATRTVIQLSLIGLVLKTLFETVHLGWIALLSFIMLTIAGWEVMARQGRRYSGVWGFGIGATSMFCSSFVITVLVLHLVIAATPWYTPQYAIPLLGMMLGNTMNSIALGLDQLTRETWRGRGMIEARLLMGQTWQQAILPIRKAALKTSMIPTINAMAAAGLVSIPGMMTGQILAGNSPDVAVRYQILIMFMVTAGAGFGSIIAIWLGAKRLFDHRQRLRLDRLQPEKA
ncbi:MAG: iron export ABC transporter permease subunit FetB [Magnetococcales bacterium]|nr:iron export ABC transporter permease subunit FetB [Magnetococcales bacterium]